MPPLYTPRSPFLASHALSTHSTEENAGYSASAWRRNFTVAAPLKLRSLTEMCTSSGVPSSGGGDAPAAADDGGGPGGSGGDAADGLANPSAGFDAAFAVVLPE